MHDDQERFETIGQDFDIPVDVVDTTAEALGQARHGLSPAARATRVRRARKTPAAAKPAARKAVGPRAAAPRKRREPR